MQELCELLKVKSLKTKVCHPQTDDLVERFNKPLKVMLKKLAASNPCHWGRLLPPLLFAIREVPQASMGFLPFELLYGRPHQGILGLLQEAWEEREPRATSTL